MKTIGVIGLGSIGMRHAKNLMDLGHHVVGFDPKNIGDGFASIWPINWSRIGELDGIVIASPTEAHAIDIRSANIAGIKTFVEKPIMATIMERCTTNVHFVLMCGFNLRFHACVKKAKQWLYAGEIGNPIWANFTLGQFSMKTPYLRDGVILNWSHEIDLCLHLLGPAQYKTSSTRLTNGKDDITDINLIHENFCRSTIHLDYVTNPEIRQFTIVGDKGQIHCDVVARIIKRYSDDGVIQNYSKVESWNDNYIEEMQAFIQRIDGKETLGCTADEALKVLDICLQVRKDAGLTT